MRLNIIVAPPTEIGELGNGRRRYIPIGGGKFEGEQLQGRILPGGGDWLFQGGDNISRMDARYVLETDRGEFLYIQDRGYRHGPEHTMLRLARGEVVNPADYYFRTSALVETASPSLKWLNNTVIIGSGMRQAGEVIIDFFTVA